jgi:site-specific recombinase XerD
MLAFFQPAMTTEKNPMLSLSWSSALALHRAHLLAKRRNARTLAWYAEELAIFTAWYAPADSLPDAETIDRFLAAQHAAGKAPSTVHARFRALRAVFLFLERRRYLTPDTNPLRVLDAPSVPQVARRHVTLPDLARLHAVCSGGTWLAVRDQLLLGLLFYSGLRVAELCALTVSDVDTTALTVLVRAGKGEKARLVPFPPPVAALFVRYLYLRPVHVAPLLLAATGQRNVKGPLTRDGVRQILRKRCAQAGIDPVYNPHAFRHGFAMWLLNSGARMTTVATAMGHSDSQITAQIYAHTTVATVRREYDEALARLHGNTPHDSKSVGV